MATKKNHVTSLSNSQVDALGVELEILNRQSPRLGEKALYWLGRLEEKVESLVKSAEKAQGKIFDSFAAPAKEDSKELVPVNPRDPNNTKEKPKYRKGQKIVEEFGKDWYTYQDKTKALLEEEVEIELKHQFTMEEFTVTDVIKYTKEELKELSGDDLEESPFKELPRVVISPKMISLLGDLIAEPA